MNTITYAFLTENNFNEDSLDDFLRHQVVTERWRKNIDNEYVLIVDPKMEIDNPVLLKIDTAWCKNYGIKFSYDPTSASNCVLSYNCIPPNLISIVDENEYEEIYNNQLEAADFSMLH